MNFVRKKQPFYGQVIQKQQLIREKAGFHGQVESRYYICLFSDVHGEGILKAVLGVGFRRGF